MATPRKVTDKVEPETVVEVPAAVVDDPPVEPETELSELEKLKLQLAESQAALAKQQEEAELKDIKDKIARTETDKYLTAQDKFDTTTADDENTILIHFVADGLTAQGTVWVRGQEARFVKGSQAYEETKDRNGDSWLDLVDDARAQWKRWGEEKFRRGPWPYGEYNDDLAKADRARNGAVPLL